MIDKKNCDREELIRRRFSEMVKMVKALPTEAELADYAKENKYIRIGGEQYVGVSLDDKFPLCGYGAKSIDIEVIKTAFSKNVAGKMDSTVLEKKEERRLQAFIIKEGLKNNRKLSKLLDVEHYFDELFFCLDEVSLGDNKHPIKGSYDGSEKKRPNIVRCDILAVGVKAGVYSPVLIELKSVRSLGRLVDQLGNFIHDISHPHELNEKFMELIKICAGVPQNSNFKNTFKKMIVWPKHDNPRKATCDILEKNNVIQVEYTLDDEQRWSFCCKK